MKVKNRTSQSNQTPVAPIATGILLSIGICCILTAILAALVLKKGITDTVINYLIYGISCIAVWIPVAVFGGRMREKNNIICIGIAIGYLLIMISINIILYDGIFAHVIPMMISAATGCGIGWLISGRKGMKCGKRKHPYR